ncbi:MAG: DUF4832 domain-containing protein [Cryomorphaceae bacterium]
MMGYNDRIENAISPEQLSLSENLSVDVTVNNIGVAPMYFDLDVQVALLDTSGRLVSKFDVNCDLTTVLPQESFRISTTNTLSDLTAGPHQLAMRIIQPGADQQKANAWKLDARNTCILFSNELQVIDGNWSDDNSLEGGWSSLGR